ncbi:MAG: SDR family NAD(P)-dependent oxidoreductase, partial [Deltaproteobacteria bacterium]|nr:SDR family NAD(P)-dependent oxidoreductase [Deltaproteobacteria bacterium]
MRDLGLKDKVVLITGGAGVLGTAFSQGFTDHGAKLAINDLKEEKALECIDKLTGDVTAVPAQGDVSDDADVARMVAGVVERFGTIDVVVNAAAVQIYPPKTIIEMEPGEWDFVLDICLKAAYLSTRHVAPVMKRQGGGKIVNIASIAGHRGSAGGSAYSAAKG